MANAYWISTSSGDLNVGANYASGSKPAAGDNLTFLPGTAAVTSNLTGLNTATLTGALAAVRFMKGYTNNVGSNATPMQITCTSFIYDGTGAASYFDLEASACTPVINNTGTATGNAALFMIGSALTGLTVNKGSVGLATLAGQTATAATITTGYVTTPATDATLVLGSGVTMTTGHFLGGVVTQGCAATTVNQTAGTWTSTGSGAITTRNMRGGTAYPNSSGTISTDNLFGGVSNYLTSRTARTVSALNIYKGATLMYDPSVVTMTAKVAPAEALTLVAS